MLYFWFGNVSSNLISENKISVSFRISFSTALYGGTNAYEKLFCLLFSRVLGQKTISVSLLIAETFKVKFLFTFSF